MILGYCRGENKQTADRQERSIRKEYPDAEIFRDHGYKTTHFGGRVEKLDNWEIVKTQCEDPVSPTTLIFDTIQAVPISKVAGADQIMLNQYIRWVEAGTTLIFIKEPYINSELFEGMYSTLKRKNSPARQLLERLIQLAYDKAQGRSATAQKGVETKRAQQAADDSIRTIGRPYDTVRVSPREQMVRQYISGYSKDFGGAMTGAEIRKKILECEGVEIPKSTYDRYKRRLKEGIGIN